MNLAIVGQGIGDVERFENRVNELIDFLENMENAVKEIVRIMREVCEKIEKIVDEVRIERERRRKTRMYMALKVLSVYTETEMLDIRRVLRRIYRARSCC
jgi:predicted transcriptional regulator